MKGKGKFGVYLAMVLIGAVGLIAYSCGSQPVNLNLKYDNTAPTGSIQGVVRNINTKALLANVQLKIQVRGGWQTTSTDSNGKFFMSGIPINNTYLLYSTLTGYTTRISTVAIGASYDKAQNTPIWLDTPQDLGNIYLYPSDASLEVIVSRSVVCGSGCTGAGTVSQNGASVTVSLLNTYDYVQTQTSASSSVIDFSGLPGSSAGVSIASAVTAAPIDCSGGTLVGTTITCSSPGGAAAACPGGPSGATQSSTVGLYDGVKSKVWINYGTCVTP